MEKIKPKRNRNVYGKWRFALLLSAFLLVLINPFLNYYLHINYIQGWYQSFGLGQLWFVSPLEGLESLLISKTLFLPTLVGMIIPLIIVIFLGRVFCSWVCPVSFFLEIFDRLRKLISRKHLLPNRLLVAKKMLWFTLIAEFIISMVIGAPLFVFLSPPGLIGREIMMLVFFKTIAVEGLLLVGIVFLEFLTRRFFCRSFCPLGGLLAFLGRKRSLKVQLIVEKCTVCNQCDLVCPMGLQPSIGEGVSDYCWNCGECLDICADSALQFYWEKNNAFASRYNGDILLNKDKPPAGLVVGGKNFSATLAASTKKIS